MATQRRNTLPDGLHSVIRGRRANGPLHTRWPLRLATVAITMATVNCASAGAQAVRPHHDSALVTKKHVELALKDEAALASHYGLLPKKGEAWFATLDGCAEVLVTAPHATQPTRNGKLRFPDAGTGSLSVSLHRIAGTRVIHTTLASPSDPNYYDVKASTNRVNAFKGAVSKALTSAPPQVVLDLHGSHWNRPYDIDFGTMNGKSLQGRTHLLTALAESLARGCCKTPRQTPCPTQVGQARRWQI